MRSPVTAHLVGPLSPWVGPGAPCGLGVALWNTSSATPSPEPCNRTILLVSYHVNSFFVSVFASWRKPNTSQSCRTSLEPSPTTTPSSLIRTSLHTDEPCPPRHRASPVRFGSRDHARRVHRTTVSRFVKTYSSVDHCSLTIGHAMRRAEFVHAALERARCRIPVGQPCSCWAAARMAAWPLWPAHVPSLAEP
jgi:hypothetical protein